LRDIFLGAFLGGKGNGGSESHGRAAKAAGLRHAIWSTLEDTRKWVPLSDNRMPTLHGKYKVPHFDGKANPTSISRMREFRRPSC